jgi:hypothetical protein
MGSIMTGKDSPSIEHATSNNIKIEEMTPCLSPVDQNPDPEDVAMKSGLFLCRSLTGLCSPPTIDPPPPAERASSIASSGSSFPYLLLVRALLILEMQEMKTKKQLRWPNNPSKRRNQVNGHSIRQLINHYISLVLPSEDSNSVVARVLSYLLFFWHSDLSFIVFFLYFLPILFFMTVGGWD